MCKYFILVWRMGKFHFVHFKLFCGLHGNKTRTRGQVLPQYKERPIWYFELDRSGCDDFWEDEFSFRAGVHTGWMTLGHLTVYSCSKRLEILCFFFFFFNLLNLFILFILWLPWVFFTMCRLSLVAASRGYSSSLRVGFSLWWLL